MILNNVGRACDVKLYLGHSSLLLIRTSLDVDVDCWNNGFCNNLSRGFQYCDEETGTIDDKMEQCDGKLLVT